MLNMLRLKKVLFDNFDGQKIYISSNGIVSMNFSIDNARIIANNQRIIIGNSNERDFIINLLDSKKFIIDKSEFKITFVFNNLQIELQVWFYHACFFSSIVINSVGVHSKYLQNSSIYLKDIDLVFPLITW